jgi:hypothetical protein
MQPSEAQTTLRTASQFPTPKQPDSVPLAKRTLRARDSSLPTRLTLRSPYQRASAVLGRLMRPLQLLVSLDVADLLVV